MKPPSIFERIDRYAATTLVAGLLLTALLAYRVHAAHENHIRASVHDAAEPLFMTVLGRVTEYKYGLISTRAAVLGAGVDAIRRPRFTQFSEALDLPRDFPGARGFAYVRRVAPDQLDAFVAANRKTDWPDFQIKEIGPHTGDHYVIRFIEPFEPNKVAIGLDIGSEPRRRAAADAAVDAGDARLTAPITLVQEDQKAGQAFLILLPIYAGGGIPASVAERRERAIGWTLSPLNIYEVLADQHLDARRTVLRIDDVTDPAAPVPLFTSSNQSASYPYQVTQDVMGRSWRLTMSVTPLFVSQLRLLPASGVTALGMVMSLLLTGLVSMVTAQRRSTQSLRAEQTKLASIVESSNDGIIGKTLEGVIISWNSGAEKIFGYSAREAIGRPILDLLIPDRLKHEEPEILAKIRQREAISSFETVRHRKDGSELPVSVTVSPILSPTGEVIGASKTVRDISLQKQAEASLHEVYAKMEQQVEERTSELAELNLLLNTVLSAASDFAIVVTDMSGTIRLFNRGAEQMLGYCAEEVVGRINPAIFHDADEVAARAAELSEELGQPIAPFEALTWKPIHEGTESREWLHRRKDGSLFPVSLFLTAMRNAEDEFVGILGIARDITRERAMRQGLIEAKEQADAASNAKSMFLANMSHEIRTPMNAVLGMLKLLLRTSLSSRQRDYAGKAQMAATSLLSLLNDILDYSKVNAGKLELDPHPFDLNSLMEHLAVVLSGNLRSKAIELLFDIDDALPHFLIGDQLRLQQVLINLASNAIKFTESGEVVIRMRQLSRNQQEVTLRISVSDTGIGIAPEQQQRIFEGFTQAEASTTRRYGGTGLGLVISQLLVQLMGGELKLKSEVGRGSEFWFSLTLPIDTDRPSQRSALHDIAPRILVVDDNPVALELLAASLSQLGAQVLTSRSGEAALQLLERQPPEHQVDLVLMDWLMPGLDGVETARRIRQRAFAGGTPRIVLVTAATTETLPSSDDHPELATVLTKPVTPQQLRDTVLRVLDGSSMENPVSESKEQRQQPLAGLSLLLVEDNPYNQMVASELLGAEGAQVDVVSGGVDGVQRLQDAPLRYDLVLMDIQMPDIDGLEATRRIRALPGLASIPIVAMTANVSIVDQQACLDAGMNAHLGKPLDLIQVVSTILKLTGRGLTTPEPARSAQAALDEAIARFGGNEALFRKLLEGFMPSFSGLAEKLSAAEADHDRQGQLDVLHGMRGMAGTAGFTALFARIVEIETALRQGPSAPARPGLAAELLKLAKTEYSRILQSLPITGESTERAAPWNQAELMRMTEAISELLESGNLKAIDAVIALQEQLADRKPLSADLDALRQATEGLDFESAGARLASLRRSL